MDGTFSHDKALQNITHSLKRHQVVLFYVWQDPILAWKLTQDRELVTKRAVQKDGFINSCIAVPKNIKKLLETHGSVITVVAIEKTENHRYQVLNKRSQIDELLERTYTKKELESKL